MLNLLARCKSIRGSLLDPFAYSADRKLEYAIIKDFEDDMELIKKYLNTENSQVAAKLAEIPKTIRGYGPVKENNYKVAQQQRLELRQQMGNALLKTSSNTTTA